MNLTAWQRTLLAPDAFFIGLPKTVLAGFNVPIPGPVGCLVAPRYSEAKIWA
jgi:hypothetical protein